jgi:hypothetical protein
MAYSYAIKKSTLKTRSKIALLNLIHHKASDLLELSHVDAAGSLSAAEWLQMAATIKKEF